MIDENSLIEKSRNVVAMQCLSMGEQELKILDVYLSRINPRDKSTREVEFTKKEYEDLLGVVRIDTQRLNEYIQHLMKNIVKINVPLKNGRKNILNRCLFPSADLIWNEKDREYRINLSINPQLDAVFFNIKNLGYIRYRLKNIVKLQSKYDIKIYLLLKLYEYDEPHEIEMSLDELKQKIECNKESYKKYNEFNRVVLKQSIQRINDFTDIQVSYKKPRKKSYEEEKIIFTVSRKPKEPKEVAEHEPKVIAEFEHEVKVEELIQAQQPEQKEYDNPYNLPLEVVEETNQEKIKKLVDNIKSYYPNADEAKIKHIFKLANRDCNFPEDTISYYNYYRSRLLDKLDELEKMAAEKNKPKKPNPKGFDNFEQRATDYDALLRQLNKRKM